MWYVGMSLSLYPGDRRIVTDSLELDAHEDAGFGSVEQPQALKAPLKPEPTTIKCFKHSSELLGDDITIVDIINRTRCSPQNAVNSVVVVVLVVVVL
eukprot:4017832-Amphidinium_carterae.1